MRYPLGDTTSLFKYVPILLIIGTESLLWPTVIGVQDGFHKPLEPPPNGAVFTRVGTVYTGLAYGHIVMRYNLSNQHHPPYITAHQDPTSGH